MNAERRRLEAIDEYELSGWPRDPALDDVARLAAQVCGAPAGGVAIAGRGDVLLLGGHGLAVVSLPTGVLPCGQTMEAEGVFQVPGVQRANPAEAEGFQVGGERFRMYAGAPVVTPAGVAIGCVFVLDTRARMLTGAETGALEALSHLVTTRLELSLRVRENHRGSRARQRVEAALTVEKNFVSTVLDMVGALVVVFDPEGRIVRFNRACEAITGYRAAEVVGTFAWERLVPAAEAADAQAGFAALRGDGLPAAFENHWVAKDGSWRRISWSATALLSSRGEVTFVIATGMDVTQQRAAENAIRESEARYRQLVEGSLGLVCTHDLEGRILSVNEYGARSLGRDAGEVVGRSLLEFVLPGPTVFDRYFRALQTTGEAQGLMHLRHRNGETRVLAYRNRLVAPRQGAPYVLALAVDISERVRAEAELRTLSRQSDSVLESVGDGIFGMDMDGRVTVVNPAAEQILGYAAQELLGRDAHETFHHSRADGTPYPRATCPIQGSLRERSTIRVAHEVFWRKDGTPVPVEYIVRPQVETPRDGQDDGAGRTVGAVVAFTDISERDALDRMKDEFISTVSHELRTPLTSLRAALGLITGGTLSGRPEKMAQMMEIAIGNTDRLVRLVNDVLDLERIGSGKAEMHFSYCEVEEIFQRGMALLESQAAKNNLHFESQGDGVTVWADCERILQTVVHLLSNAIKFAPRPDGAPGRVRLTASRQPGGEALIEIADQGAGIPENKLQEIFERFRQVDASDARSMGGTGLGLAICRSIVTQHGGRIWATSQPGKGATLHFTLPAEPKQRLG